MIPKSYLIENVTCLFGKHLPKKSNRLKKRQRKTFELLTDRLVMEKANSSNQSRMLSFGVLY